MAGIFYLPRIFVHYVDGVNAGQEVERLKIMAQKLYSFMTLIAGFSLASGLFLWIYYDFSGGWLHAKLSMVVCLIIYHVLCRRYVIQMQAGPLNASSRYFRMFNEIPLFIFAAIVVLVIVKPF